MDLKCSTLISIFFPFALIFFNEYLIFYLAFLRCSWPAENRTNILILADTHLLGVYRGHFLDKLKREWQMYRSFQTAISIFQPQVVFFLGDLFDEGLLGEDKIFNSYVKRFNDLFYVNSKIQRFVVMGNHDIGYHREIFLQRLIRFTKSFEVSNAVDYIEIEGNIFILINSMAMEGDHCMLCSEATLEIKKISKILECTQNFVHGKCNEKLNINYTRPIIMQHFPLFRHDDQGCDKTLDLAPSIVRQQKFKEKFDCLSKESTVFLLKQIQPRAVFGGHTHYGCKKLWENPLLFWEYTVPSFSWRNNRHPSFLLLSVSATQMDVSSCFIPDEYYLIVVYVISFLAWFSKIIFNLLPKFKRKKSIYTNILFNTKKVNKD